MKLNIPFYKSQNDIDCGQLTLKMVLAYFNDHHSTSKLGNLMRTLPSGLTWTQGIAVAAKKLGYSPKIISTSNFSHEDKDIEYYIKNSNEEGTKILYELIKESKELKIPTIEKDLSLEDLTKLLTKNSPLIALINWNVIKEKEGYQGHFIPITGYNKYNILIHNPGLDRQKSNLEIKRDTFKKAWESKGTDKDLIVISKRKS